MTEDLLECNHCGGSAVESVKGLFHDGQGGACITCGFPGSVTLDSETPPYWNESDDPDARCTDPGCSECHPTAETFPEYEGQGP